MALHVCSMLEMELMDGLDLPICNSSGADHEEVGSQKLIEVPVLQAETDGWLMEPDFTLTKFWHFEDVHSIDSDVSDSSLSFSTSGKAASFCCHFRSLMSRMLFLQELLFVARDHTRGRRHAIP